MFNAYFKLIIVVYEAFMPTDEVYGEDLWLSKSVANAV